jgi:hypothetical protein
MENDELTDIKNRLEKLEQVVFGSKIEFNAKQMTPREFLKQSDAKGEVEITLLFAFFLEMIRGLKPITRAMLEDIFREAKSPPPAKLSDKIYQNVRKGFLMEVDPKANPKIYELTSSGIDHVQGELLKIA